MVSVEGDGHTSNSRGIHVIYAYIYIYMVAYLYIYIYIPYKDFPIKGGMTIPDLGTYVPRAKYPEGNLT